MSNKRNLEIAPGESMVCQIRLKGHLGSQWTEWFGGLVITLEEGGDTLLTGPVADQAALYGLLRKVRDLGMPLVSVNPVEPSQAAVPDGTPEVEASESVKKDPHEDVLSDALWATAVRVVAESVAAE